MTNTTSKKGNTTANGSNLDYSKAEKTFENIIIPNSQFQAKWKIEEGYSVGIENIKLTKNYKTLEEALNQIGYGVEKDKEGDDVLMKVGEVDYELIVRIVKAIAIIEEQNKNVIPTT